MKNLIVIEKSISENKSFCFQTALFRPWFGGGLFVDLELLTDECLFKFAFCLFGLIDFTLEWTRRCDHAGFRFNFTLIGLLFTFYIYDNRHWDDEKNAWEVYEPWDGIFRSPGISTREN